jgi:hypothetical protein
MHALLLVGEGADGSERFRRLGDQPPGRAAGSVLPDWVEDGDGEVASLERDAASPGRDGIGCPLLGAVAPDD